MLRRFVIRRPNSTGANELRRGATLDDPDGGRTAEDADGGHATVASRLLDRAVHVALVLCLLPALLLVLLVGVIGLLAERTVYGVRCLRSWISG
jgi:hypothetical protein